MNIAIYTLFQRKELSKIRVIIKQFSAELTRERRLYILVNDSCCNEIKELAERVSPYIIIIQAGKNLGVAGGRNVLIDRALRDGAEYFISCDSDIIFQPGYVDSLVNAHKALVSAGAKVGFIQPLLLDGRFLKDTLNNLSVSGWSDVEHLLATDDEWATKLGFHNGHLQFLARNPKAVFHAGISHVWLAHFGAPLDTQRQTPDQQASISNHRYETTKYSLRDDAPALRRVLDSGKPVRVASTAGGISAFHANALLSRTPYDEIFNPFGYEDSELGFRLNLSGVENFLIPTVTAIHDPFMGVTHRHPMSHSRIGLLRGRECASVLASKAQREYMLSQSIFDALPNLIGNVARYAVEIDADPTHANNLYASFVASYYFDFIRAISINQENTSSEEGDSFFNFIRSFERGGDSVRDIILPLSTEVRLHAGLGVSRKCVLENDGTRYLAHLFNVRMAFLVQNHWHEGRYFDISIRVDDKRINSAGILAYEINYQAHDDTCCIKAEFAIRDSDSPRLGALSFNGGEFFQKKYDFGDFSEEELYPKPAEFKNSSSYFFIEDWFSKLSSNSKSNVWAQSFSAWLRRFVFCLPSAVPALSPGVVAVPKSGTPFRKQRVLVFTDSRGQHKPAGTTHQIFGERLHANPYLDVDLLLCPMKWTTTLDLFELFSDEALQSYDKIILYTGIVDWSPRRQSSAIDELYNNAEPTNLRNERHNTPNYSRKVVNNKRDIFDQIFGRAQMQRHLQAPFPESYEGESTINLYSLTMAKNALLPKLMQYKNIYFINSNRFVEGWNGDYQRARPGNIGITHRYSDLFSNNWPKDRLVDLREWGDEQVKTFTCDNLHLTEAGSDWIYERLLELLDLPPLFSDVNKAYRGGDFMAALKGYSKLSRVQPSFSHYLANAEKAMSKCRSQGLEVGLESRS